MQKFYFLLITFSMYICACAQNNVQSPFDIFGPSNAPVYKDLKEALKDYERVYKLNLSNQPIEPKLFLKLGKLTNLQALLLMNNNINSLPEEIGTFNSLMFLSSRGNEIKILPVGFGNLTSLMQLELYDTKLDSLPSEIGYLNRLKTFHIQSNKDTLRLPHSIGYLKSLSEFLVYNTVLDTLPKEFGNLANLKSLTLVQCQLKVMRGSLGKLSNLEELVLDNNLLDHLPVSIYHLKNLQYLSIKNNKFSKLSEHICYLKGLTTLDVRGNSITEEEVNSIKALLPGCKVLWK